MPHLEQVTSFPGRWSRWREHRRQGLGTFTYHLLRRLLEHARVLHWLDVQVHQVIAIEPWHLRIPTRLPRELSVRELGGADIEALTRLRPANGRGYEQRLEAGHRALGAFLGERLAAFVWLRRGPVLLPTSFGCVWQLSAPMAWIYDLYSDPGVLGAIPHLYAYLRQHPPEAGCRLFVGQTEYDNWASRRTHQHLGYEMRATLFSLRLGPCHLHLSYSVRERRWRRHRRPALLPLERFTAGLDALTAAPLAAAAPAGDACRLQCRCGREVGLEPSDGPITCVCGQRLGERRNGVAAVGAAIGYWGEVSQAQMRMLLERAERSGWRPAVEATLPEHLHRYVADPDRAAFQDVLPLPPGARVLDIGAGLGGIATALARRYQVVALEGVAERARFIALRQQQDQLSRLTVIQGNLHHVPLALHQFDLIVVNGVLEWVALHDLSAPPETVQLVFLHRLRELLAPGGRIYIGIENRYGWWEWRGALDHSGLPYTSLMPRFMARWCCAHSRRYRSHFNAGYRTYTYSHRGYARLFEQVGLRIESSWIAPTGYNHPGKLVPLDAAAIRFASRLQPEAPGMRGRLRSAVRQGLARELVWRWIGADFALLAAPAAGDAASVSVAAPASAATLTPGAGLNTAYHA